MVTVERWHGMSRLRATRVRPPGRAPGGCPARPEGTHDPDGTHGQEGARGPGAHPGAGPVHRTSRGR